MNKIFIQTYNVMKGEFMKHYLLIATLGLVACEDNETETTNAVTSNPTVTETTETVTTANIDNTINEEVIVETIDTNKVIIKNNNDVNKGETTNEND